MSIECPRCHKQVPEDSKACPHCNMLLKFEKKQKGLLDFFKDIIFWNIDYSNVNKPLDSSQILVENIHQNYDMESYTIKVAGVTFENRQHLFKELIDLAKQETPKSEFYDGMTNQEIEEYATEPVQEIAVSGAGEIFLVPEPDNKEDPNAIAVHHESVGKLGYIPHKEVDKIKEILEDRKSYIEWEIVGGKYKVYDESEEKVVIEEFNYGMRLTFNYGGSDSKHEQAATLPSQSIVGIAVSKDFGAGLLFVLDRLLGPFIFIPTFILFSLYIFAPNMIMLFLIIFVALFIYGCTTYRFGVCPYCGVDLKGIPNDNVIICKACKNRVIFKDEHFYKINN